jgi:transcriptional regulator with XRE-family HTH domain
MNEVQLKSLQSIGELIHYYRLTKGYSQKDLADKLHVTISAISSWERGQNKPSLDIALLIASDLGITLDEFFLYRQPLPVDVEHSIYEVITFNHAYIEIHHIHLDQDQKLHVVLLLSGLTLTMEIIDFYSEKATFTSNGAPLTFTRKTKVLSEEKISISPEMDQGSMSLRRFECDFILEYPNDDLIIALSCQDQIERFRLKHSVLDLLLQGPSNDHLPTQDFFTSPDHAEILRYLSKDHQMDSLNEYIMKLYQQLPPMNP